MRRLLLIILLLVSLLLMLGCEGPAGPTGPQGPQGEQGVQGPQGEQGKPGSQVSESEPVPQAPESQPVSTPPINLVEDFAVPTKADCLREAGDSSYVDAIRLRTLQNADPNGLTDEERFAWHQFFMHTNSELRSSCITYWSEAITVENAEKRNVLVEGLPNECLESVEQRIQAQSSYDLAGNRGAWVDAYTLLRRPYLSLTITERSVLREILYDSWDCQRYYPQLFSGRWIPLTDVANGITTGTPVATPTPVPSAPTRTPLLGVPTFIVPTPTYS